ncbi:hypothetical protein PAEPH01_0583 [Pancytospora epiphaga]|nr:hypothetical protein PAEPH01_0583 [Pancytospora epiphaga]
MATRCAAIYKVKAECHSHLSNIKKYLRVRYAMAEKVTAKSLGAAQIAQLYSDILKKDRHKKLYNVRENEQASIVDSSVWLKHGNIYKTSHVTATYIFVICLEERQEHAHIARNAQRQSTTLQRNAIECFTTTIPADTMR